jgi:hypothetical protein
MCEVIKALEPGSVVLQLDSASEATTRSDALFASVRCHACTLGCLADSSAGAQPGGIGSAECRSDANGRRGAA